MTYRFKFPVPVDVHPQEVKDYLDPLNVKIDAISAPIDEHSRLFFCSTEDQKAYEYFMTPEPSLKH